jgi:hypothetical protein
VGQEESPVDGQLKMTAVMDSYGLQVMVCNVAVVVAQAQTALEVQVVAVMEVSPVTALRAQLIQDQVAVVVELVHLEVRAVQVW